MHIKIIYTIAQHSQNEMTFSCKIKKKISVITTTAMLRLMERKGNYKNTTFLLILARPSKWAEGGEKRGCSLRYIFLKEFTF